MRRQGSGPDLRWPAATTSACGLAWPPVTSGSAGPGRDISLDLGLTHFIDDRPDVHETLRGAADCQYVFGPQAAPGPRSGIHTPTWADVQHLVGQTLLQ